MPPPTPETHPKVQLSAPTRCLQTLQTLLGHLNAFSNDSKLFEYPPQKIPKIIFQDPSNPKKGCQQSSTTVNSATEEPDDTERQSYRVSKRRNADPWEEEGNFHQKINVRRENPYYAIRSSGRKPGARPGHRRDGSGPRLGLPG